MTKDRIERIMRNNVNLAIVLLWVVCLVTPALCEAGSRSEFYLLTFQFSDVESEEIYWVCDAKADTVDFEKLIYVNNSCQNPYISRDKCEYFDDLMMLNKTRRKLLQFYSSTWPDGHKWDYSIAVYVCPFVGDIVTYKSEDALRVERFGRIKYAPELLKTKLFDSLQNADFYSFNFVKYSMFKHQYGPQCFPTMTMPIDTIFILQAK